MDAMLEQYLKQKYGEDYEQKAQGDYDEKESQVNTGSFISSLGDALAGRAPGSQNEYFNQMKKQAKESTIGKIDADRKNYMATVGFENQQKEAKQKSDQFDPMSASSQNFRKIMESQYPDVAKAYGDQWKNVSAGDQETVFNPLKFKEQQKTRIQQAELLAGNRKDAREQRDFEREQKQNEKNELLMTTFGKARTPDDAKKIKDGAVLKENFDAKLKEMIALREKHGGGAIMNREDVQRGQQLSKDLLLAYKDMSKLGVLSQSDEKILNAIIPEDPLAYNSPLAAIQGQDPILNRMQKFQGDASRDFDNRLKNSLRNPQKLEPQKTIVKTQVNQKTGETRVVYSDGTTEIQPKQAGK